MANKGEPSLHISGVTFTTSSVACLQSVTYADTADEVEYLCSNRHVRLPGAATAMLSASVAIASTDVATLAALKSVAILTDFAYYPFGSTTTYIGITSDNSTVFGFSMGEAVNNVVMVDCNVAVNNPVVAAKAP